MTPASATPAEHSYTLTLSLGNRTVASLEGVSYRTAQAAFPNMLADHTPGRTETTIQQATEHWDEPDETNTLTLQGVTANLYARN